MSAYTSYTRVSMLAILTSYMIHYGYTDYVRKKGLDPKRYVLFANYGLVAAAFGGWVYSVARKAPNKRIFVAAGGILAVSAIAVMHGDVNRLREENSLSLTNPNGWVLTSVLAWLTVGFSVGKQAGAAAVAISVILYYLLPKIRAIGISDNPYYLLLAVLMDRLAKK